MEHGKKLGPIWESAREVQEPGLLGLNFSPFPSEEAIEAWTAHATSPLFDEAEAPKN